MSIMNGVFHEEMNECMVIYIDNILKYSKNEVDHAQDLKRFFSILR